MPDDTPAPDVFVPAKGKTIHLPGTGGQLWPKDGRPINPASAFEQRLVRDGDLVKGRNKQSADNDGNNGGEK